LIHIEEAALITAIIVRSTTPFLDHVGCSLVRFPLTAFHKTNPHHCSGKQPGHKRSLAVSPSCKRYLKMNPLAD